MQFKLGYVHAKKLKAKRSYLRKKEETKKIDTK